MSRIVSGTTENHRIDSWKEIAAFFGKDERTVKRWEKDRSLPIHRVPGSGRGGVFAYTQELTSWLHSTPPEKVIVSPAAPEIIPIEDEPTSHPDPIISALEPILPSPAKLRSLSPRRSLILLSFFVIAVILLLFLMRRSNESTRARNRASTTLRGTSRHKPGPQAEEFYLHGRYYWSQRTTGGLNKAVDSFTQAILLDANYAEAYAGLADCYDLMPEYSSLPSSEAYPRAISAATKAVTLDDSLSEAHRALAFGLFYWNWEIPRALLEYQKALKLNPNDVEAHHWYATSLLSLQRFPEALIEIENARKLNPTSPSILADRALILYMSGERQAGISALREIENTEPAFLSPPRYLERIFFEQKDYPAFLKELKHAAVLSKGPEEIALSKAAASGWERNGVYGMLEEMRKTQQTFFNAGQSSGLSLARTNARLGRRHEAIQCLQSAASAHDDEMLAISGSELAASLKGDPTFDQISASIQQSINGGTRK